jgi:hypothetical protein
MDEENKNKATVYYKDKAAYNQALLDALKDVRKKRVDDPTRAFKNAVVAFQLILLPDERDEVNAYKLDTSDHKKEINKILETAEKIEDEPLKIEYMVTEYRAISWPELRKLCNYLLDNHKFIDVSGDGQLDRDDVTIVIYEALLERIIQVLKNHGWLTFESEYDVKGGGGSALETDEKKENEIDDDLAG